MLKNTVPLLVHVLMLFKHTMRASIHSWQAFYIVLLVSMIFFSGQENYVQSRPFHCLYINLFTTKIDHLDLWEIQSVIQIFYIHGKSWVEISQYTSRIFKEDSSRDRFEGGSKVIRQMVFLTTIIRVDSVDTTSSFHGPFCGFRYFDKRVLDPYFDSYLFRDSKSSH